MLLAIVISLILSLIIMSFIEHGIHRWLMHRKLLPNIVYQIIPFLKKTYEQHTFLHHRKYYKIFNYEPDLFGRDLEIELHIWLGPVVALPVCLGLWFISPIFSIVFFNTVVLHHLVWNIVHSEMHRPKKAWFSKTRLYKYLAHNHWMHHTYPGKNFNIVLPPFADIIMRTYLRPSAKDLARMQKEGV
jgi:hypothetical protein